ncbi:MAG: T9SS type A sorting domain-containing protein [Microscillaceae bacterium]|nr:T9SS type A sorting domain-containing protein [Microscillaceae bacterium]
MAYFLKYCWIFVFLLVAVGLKAQPAPTFENGENTFDTFEGVALDSLQVPEITSNVPDSSQLVWYVGTGNNPAILATQPQDTKEPLLAELKFGPGANEHMGNAHTFNNNTYTFQVRVEKGAVKGTFAQVVYTVIDGTITLKNNANSFSTCPGTAFSPTTQVAEITNNIDNTLEFVWYSVSNNNEDILLVSQPPTPRKKPLLSQLAVQGTSITMANAHNSPPRTYTFRVKIRKKTNLNLVSLPATVTYTVSSLSAITLSGIQDKAIVCIFSQNVITPSSNSFSGNYSFKIEKFKDTNLKDNTFGTKTFPNGQSLIIDPDAPNFGLALLPRNDTAHYLLTITTVGNTCPSTRSIKFYVQEGPLAFFSFKRNEVFCDGEPVTFTIAQTTFTDFPPSIYRYEFSFEDEKIDITNSIDSTADFQYSYIFTQPRPEPYPISLTIQENDSSVCNGVWTEEIKIGNPERFSPDFLITGLRASKPTQFILENDNTLRPVDKIWYFDVFYAPFIQNSSFTFNLAFDSDSLLPTQSSNISKTYNSPGVYLAFYENTGEPFLPTANDTIKFCNELYGLPLIIFDKKEAELLDNWVSSFYVESILKDGESLINTFTSNADLSLLTTRNSSWRLRDSQTLDSTLRENVSGPVWITQGTDSTSVYNNNEKSWVQSRFFDIDTLLNPFLTFKVWFDTQPRLDGAVLEYTLGDEENWQRLGNDEDVGPDTEWYNQRGIASSPGDQSGENLGWSGKSQGWQRMRFSLKEVQEALRQKFQDEDERVLRIRIAFSSLDDNNLPKGTFAFAELKVEEADRIVLWEHFVGDEASSTQKEVLGNLTQNDPFALHINYYTNPEDDSLYRNSALEPSIGALRELYYGIGNPVNTVLDGQKDQLDSLKVDFERRKLDFTPYTITPILNTNPLRINYQVFKKDSTVFENEHRIRIALVERGLKFKNKLQKNVVRRFLPSHNGQTIPSDLAIGESFSLNEAINWPTDLTHQEVQNDPEADTLNEYPYMLVFFVQDIETKEILQTTYRLITKQEILGKEANPGNVTKSSLKVFPNPADEYLEISLGDEENFQHWELYNAWGELIQEATFETDTLRLDSRRIPAGYYLLILKDNEHTQVLKRVIIVH